MDTAPTFTVTQFTISLNDILDYTFASVKIIGEVSSFKINQGKWVFFDLKDEESAISCFMPLSQLRTPLEDGMKVVITGAPKLTKWGRFSFTAKTILPVGEGSIKRALELLKKKLQKEGLFAPEKKRPLPPDISNIGVISSPQAAGYADFIKILNERWSGLTVQVAKTQVQGLVAADQIIRALNYFNEKSTVDIIAIIRGGGSADDLSVFNDEKLVRAISASKIPVITGIGHEVDESLADLSADIVGSTPSNVAQILTSDKHTEITHLHNKISTVKNLLLERIDTQISTTSTAVTSITHRTTTEIYSALTQLSQTRKILDSLNPETALERGYAIIKGDFSPGNVVKITTHDKLISAEVKNVQNRIH